MMFRFTPLALALFAVGTQAYAANDTAAQAVQTKELDTVQVRGRRLVMETGVQGGAVGHHRREHLHPGYTLQY